MEIDPAKFALSASNSLLKQLQGAYQATEYYNLKPIMGEGFKAGRDLTGNHGSSGRLRSYWGVFPPWGQRNKVTRSRSSVDQWLPMVTLYIPIIDLIRVGGKVSESGVILCSRTVPFHLVKEVWLCLPDTARGRTFDQVEKILDYELEDKIFVEVKKKENTGRRIYEVLSNTRENNFRYCVTCNMDPATPCGRTTSTEGRTATLTSGTDTARGASAASLRAYPDVWNVSQL